MRRSVLCLLVCASMALSACGGAASHRRAGIAGACLVIVGAGTTTLARHGVDPNRDTAQTTLVTAGVSAQVVGIGMMIYALDWMMHREAEASGVLPDDLRR